MTDFKKMAVPGVQKLNPYIPGKPISELERELGIQNIIKLASNENPLGPSPLAMQAIKAEMSELALYPDGNGFELKKALAEKHGIDMSCITLGNGSNDVLVLLAEAFLSPEHNAIYSQYSFAVYPIAIQAVGAQHQMIDATSWDDEMPLGCDLPAMKAAINEQTRLIFIANPNNPTGSFLGQDELLAFIKSVPQDVIVVLDEAYLEYSSVEERVDGSLWLNEFENLVITRTFSKAYGLAGFRVGYCLSNPDIANVLNRIRQPFNVNSLALAAATAAIKDDEFLAKSMAVNAKGMKLLAASCDRLGLRFVPSKGNFLLVDFAQDAMPIYQQMLELGVITRPVANYGLPNCLRITIGSEEEMQRMTTVLEQVCG
ncbi:histidinol-phosphate transaminase [Marinicella litoralis]|uniref:Histidinol-phosphate aminotransferase n=1 Tax=Marinicella litoralis TaxID=644220 RepID=A0A4R6XG10_9GAMM|nr:histidinol-phosphate transaminase [Marinicella litoralis]TDR18315.1 histidinol-phosphate aminotransferase [Marinicella litoralis]